MEKKNKGKIAGSIIAVFVCGAVFLWSHRQDFSENRVVETFEQTQSEESAEQLPKKEIYIHICGAVKKPSVYLFSEEPRLIEVVKKAGGFTKKADKTSINLAEIVSDGARIEIPKKGKTKKKSERPNIDDGKVNLNTASKEELMTLTGIGESKADAIISYRNTSGKFQKIEDIMNISGIKQGVFMQIKEKIAV